jgi:type I restriction enzyme R subunit
MPLRRGPMRVIMKVNLVQSKRFSEMLDDAVNRYHNWMSDSITFIEEILIPMAKEIWEAYKRGANLNLDFRKLAFYDALETNDSAVAILGDEILRTIARELLQSVRNSTTNDWPSKRASRLLLGET